MNKGGFCSLLFFLCMSLFCCSQEKPQDSKILSRINDYNLTLDEFQSQLAAELELDKDFKLTEEAKREFLEELIKKELLIQEAKKLKLDRQENFVKAMERYWESTLIRNLLDLKAKEIEKNTYVSQEEIVTRYKQMRKFQKKFPPLSEMQERISMDLREEKKTRVLEEWIKDLITTAEVDINDEIL